MGSCTYCSDQRMHSGDKNRRWTQSKILDFDFLLMMLLMAPHCLQLVKELGAPVEYIVLPTFAYEHKIFVGPFSRQFPRAQVWVAPRQWSWPLNLPLEFFGIFRAKILKDEDLSTPWGDEIEQKVLSSPEVGTPLGSYFRL